MLTGDSTGGTPNDRRCNKVSSYMKFFKDWFLEPSILTWFLFTWDCADCALHSHLFMATTFNLIEWMCSRICSLATISVNRYLPQQRWKKSVGYSALAVVVTYLSKVYSFMVLTTSDSLAQTQSHFWIYIYIYIWWIYIYMINKLVNNACMYIIIDLL